MTQASFIGIDLGGTRIKAGLFPHQTLVLDNLVRADGLGPDFGGPPDLVVPVVDRSQVGVVAQLAALVAELSRRHDHDSGGLVVGIAAAGVLEQRTGLVRESPNFPRWLNFPLGKELSEATGLVVVLENDANAVILGEVTFGAARGCQNVAGYTLGTGVGGGLVLGGQLWRGERGMAGELGHVTVVREGRACGCGSRGCLERYAGQVGMLETLRELGPPWSNLADDAGSDAPRILAQMATAGDPTAVRILGDVGRHLGLAAATVLQTLDVTTFLLCGGIADAFGLIAPAMRTELVARSFRSMSAGVRILQGSLGARAGMLGAAAVAAAYSRS